MNLRFKQDREHTPWMKWLCAFGAAMLLAGALSPASATKLSERAKQKREAEAERAELQQKLNALKRDIDRTEVAKSHAADALAQSEAAISDANRALRDLIDEQRQTQARLDRVSREEQRLNKLVETQRKQLGQLFRQQYIAGNEDRMKLLLSGDNPNRINRELQYMGYASQAQAKLISELRGNLQSVEANKADVQHARDDLREIAEEQREQKAQLEKEKAKRAILLAQLSNKLSAQRKQADSIEQDEQRLASLVERLAKLIEEQHKIDAANREKRRQEQLARAKSQETTRQQKKDTPTAEASVNPDAIDDDEPPSKALARNELAPEGNIKNNGRPFRNMRGQLRLPVRGELIAKYGSKRGDAPSWKGLFIRTAEGAEVRSVAGGQVIFAEWLRGFGNLIIVDHGDQYMTIYGNNQALFKRAGDAIKTGDIIASAGNSGGNEQSGLYFEMRHQGRAFDPLEWVTFR